MMKIFYAVLAVALGFVLSFVTVSLVELINHGERDVLLHQLRSFDLHSELWRGILVTAALIAAAISLVLLARSETMVVEYEPEPEEEFVLVPIAAYHERRSATWPANIVPVDVPQPPAVDRAAAQPSLADSGSRNFVLQAIANRLDTLEPGLQTMVDENGDHGIEYDSPHGKIDLLAIDDRGGLVVILWDSESAGVNVLGRLLAQAGWVKQQLAFGSPVRSIVLTNDVSDDLRSAVSQISAMSACEFTLEVNLRPADAATLPFATDIDPVHTPTVV